MINLLPPTYRQNLRAGHRDTLIHRWLVIIWLATTGLVLILILAWVYFNQQSKELNQAIKNTSTQLTAQNLSGVQKQAKDLTNNIKTINQVLGREIRFSELIQDIGKVMPPGTVLNSLTLAKVNGGIDLSANAKDYSSAAQIAVNLSDPKNQIFNKVDIVTINCTSSATAYPCGGTFRALFNKTTLSHYQGVAQGSQ